MVVARIVLVLAGCALVAFGVQRHHAHERCADARRDALAVGLHGLPAGRAPGIATRLEADCRDTAVLSEGVASFLRADQTAAALGLAQTAIRREPDGRNGWIALSWARRQAGDRAGAARALNRARRLDPVGLRG
jgi:cytochrome c-type biogenesis protein CcmH/NrfG